MSDPNEPAQLADSQDPDPAVPTAPNPSIPGIRPPPPLDIEHNAAENWKLFKQKWNFYSILTNLSARAPMYQVALLLHSLGDDALRVYNGFRFATPDENRTVDEIIDQFDRFAIGEVNETYERFKFHQRSQQSGENFDTFLSALRNLLKTCKFCPTCKDGILRDRLVLGVKDSSVQAALLRERHLTLEKCIDLCKSTENAAQHHQAIVSEPVHKLAPARPLTKKKQSSTNPANAASPFRHSTSKARDKPCKFCPYFHALRKEECPAYGKTCSNCGKRNHFAAKCSSPRRTVHQVEDEEELSEPGEWINTVQKTPSRDVKCTMLVGNRKVTFQLDTGSSVNLLPARFASKVTPSPTTLRMWNHSEIQSLGTCDLFLINPLTKQKVLTHFVVCPDSLSALLGLKTCQAMQLITINDENFERVAAVCPEDMVSKHPEVFDGSLGTLPGAHHLNTDPSVQPTVMPNRRVPVAVRPKLKKELTRLINLGVITPVDEPTPWVSQMVVTEKKSGELRICMDPRELNKALLREHYTLPTLDDSLHELSNSTVFSKADLSPGYWHIQLDTESSLLTTFQTCFGRYRWLRLPFGTSVSSEIFQRKLLEALHGLPGVVCIADDVLIHGRSNAEHDFNLNKFLERCATKGIKLNRDKLELRMEKISFMGHIISREGLKTDPEKVRAITDFPTPASVEELRRFLGMVNYLARYVPHLTDLVHPLSNLLRNDVLWQWSPAQDSAFTKTKQAITSAPTLHYYNPSKELTLENDASDYGLGSALLQEGKPVAFASRSLSPSERNYAQLEKEMLAVVFGLEKFHHYSYGKNLTVITDHKPLVAIARKPLSKAPKRLQSLLLRTQVYNFDLIYRPGKELHLSDALSRAPLPDTVTEERVMVNNLQHSPVNADRLSQIRTATTTDKTLSCLAQTIRTGWPDDRRKCPPSLLPYFSYRDELTVQDGIILRSDRIVIPTSLRPEMKQKVHAGHLGINSCLRRARDLIFWPGMTTDIRRYIESCDTCASSMCQQSPEPILLHEIPPRPWEKIGTDLLQMQGRQYLVTSDYHTNFTEVDFLPDTTAATVVTKLKHHFARYGVPQTVISDSGSQFTSETFDKFAKDWNFTHIKSSPGNHKANGEAESAVKHIKRLFEKCRASREDPYLGLLNFRNTPTEGLQNSPAQRMFGRRTNSHLPCLPSKLNHDPQDGAEAARLKTSKRQLVADHTNNRRKELPALHIGDAVRMQPLDNHSSYWKTATVTKRLGKRSYEVTTEGGRKYIRNRLHLRLRKISTTHSYHNLPFYFNHTSIRPAEVDQVPTPETSNQEVPSPRHHQSQQHAPQTPDRPDAPPPSCPPATPTRKKSRIPIFQTPLRLRSGRLTKPTTRLDL